MSLPACLTHSIFSLQALSGNPLTSTTASFFQLLSWRNNLRCHSKTQHYLFPFYHRSYVWVCALLENSNVKKKYFSPLWNTDHVRYWQVDGLIVQITNIPLKWIYWKLAMRLGSKTAALLRNLFAPLLWSVNECNCHVLSLLWLLGNFM